MLRHLMLAAALGMATLVGAAGCGASDAVQTPPVCTAETDCAGGLACVRQFCTVPQANALALRARIQPPTSSKLLQQQVPALQIPDGSDITLTLVQPVTLTGVIRNQDDLLTSNLPGELEARTPGDIPGLDYRFTARSLDGVNLAGQGYELRLLPGRDYQLTFRPDGHTLPPHVLTLAAEDVVDGTLDIMLPARADYIPFQRFVRLDTAEPNHVGGARVTVFLPDGRALPSITTDPERGSFEATVPPEATQVRVTITAPAEGPLFPDFESGWLPAEPGREVEAIVIPALAPGLEPFDAGILVTAAGPDGAPVPQGGLNLTLMGLLEGGTLRRAATTDADGVARFPALPGAYEVLVSVAPGPSFGASLAKVNLTNPRGDAVVAPVEVSLPPRVPLTGQVLDVTLRPVAQGSVIATRRVVRGDNDALAIATAPFQAGLDAQGRFALLVDAGLYDLRVVPDAGTGAPAVHLSDLTLESATDLPILLPAPSLAHITILNPEEFPLEDVIVELYEGGSGGLEAPPLLQKGTTGDGGFVDLIVPFQP